MGAWGPGLHEDDVAADVHEIYMDRLRRDGDGEAACAAVCAALGDLDDDPEDGPVLWFALADTM